MYVTRDGELVDWIGLGHTGQSEWTIPASLVPGSGYRVETVYGLDNSIMDVTTNTFTIAP